MEMTFFSACTVMTNVSMQAPPFTSVVNPVPTVVKTSKSRRRSHTAEEEMRHGRRKLYRPRPKKLGLGPKI